MVADPFPFRPALMCCDARLRCLLASIADMCAVIAVGHTAASGFELPAELR
ncbi:hypothetical protein MAHJHV57_54020 [Mycobacterium avium subsp. hominissuis]